MKQYFLMLLLPLMMSICAHQEPDPTEREIEQKIAYLQKKFSHIQELVCIFESIADDIALLVHTKNEIDLDGIHAWLVSNDLMRIKKNRIYDEATNTKECRRFTHAFERLSVPQFAYLRTYIKLHNQLLRSGAVSGSIFR